MELVRFNPTRELTHFRKRMDNVFDDFFGDFFKGTRTDLARGWNPKVDIFEADDKIVMKAELPGVDKDRITIDVNGRILTVKGERAAENEVNEDRYYMRECTYGSFERSFTLPAETDSEKIRAEYKDGVLTLDIPKPESRKPKKITVH